MGAAKKVAVHAAAGAFNLLYRLFGLVGRRDEVLFVSRKADRPSYDYEECGKAFARRGLTPVYLAQRLGAKTLLPYAWLALREIYHLARCRVCVIDRYDPIVSLIDFECEPVPSDGCTALHNDFPTRPVVVQLWHAFGAFKKFGYQCLDIAEGHSSEEAALFKIHRNCSWVVCSGEGARAAFAEAFACPVERVVPLSRPTQRRLRELASEHGARPASERPRVLFAPTIRKYDKAAHPVQDLIDHADELFAEAPFDVEWALHPLEQGKEAAGGVPAHLLAADYVVTDYSSIVYEAWLLGKRVAFFVPDAEHYRTSPGLNVDPTEVCPGLCASDAEGLRALLDGWVRDPRSYPVEELAAFVDGAFDGSGDDPAEDLAAFVCARLDEQAERRDDRC
ncbi:MAG TPA: CDP-glycerol glycerophosphotransferase family protein [Candidatus Aphodovivens excrementavium]|nr:CDP-glycerol glycerophosphotransferase family protein [Candidatus Aphodovivens excrementavium]